MKWKVEAKNRKNYSIVTYEYGWNHYENGQFYEEELTDEALMESTRLIFDAMSRTRLKPRVPHWDYWGRQMGKFRVNHEDAQELARNLKEIFDKPTSTYKDRDETGRMKERPDEPKEWDEYLNKSLYIHDNVPNITGL